MELVMFTGKDCKPCNAMKPYVEEIAKDNNIKFRFIDRDTNMKMCQEYGVFSVPVTIVFKNDKPYWSQIGLIKKDALDAKVKELKGV